jgi:hypothetical protein
MMGHGLPDRDERRVAVMSISARFIGAWLVFALALVSVVHSHEISSPERSFEQHQWTVAQSTAFDPDCLSDDCGSGGILDCGCSGHCAHCSACAHCPVAVGPSVPSGTFPLSLARTPAGKPALASGVFSVPLRPPILPTR